VVATVRIINGKEITVTHIMKNGEVRDSLEGYKVSVDDLPAPALRILRQMLAV